MIRVRVDDVLRESKEFTNERASHQIYKLHRWLVQASDILIHIPTILVCEITPWPDVVEWMREEATEGRMSPQLHGYQHIDYSKLELQEIEEHLEMSISWFKKHLHLEPTVWATPWGGTCEKMEEAAAKFYLTVETTQNTITPGAAVRLMKKAGSAHAVDGSTVMTHWWCRGLQVLRMVEIARCGSYESAVKWDKHSRRKKERLF